MTAATRAPAPPRAAALPLRREQGPDARPGRLHFAQVREDPALELEALRPVLDGTIVAVASGGCTALSLVGAGAERVIGVDLNPAQNHLVELKAAAVARLDRRAAIAFLGGAPDAPGRRTRAYRGLRDALTPAARTYWDARARDVEAGVIGCGVTERFIGAVGATIRLLIHPRRRIHRLLACRSVEEQREFYRAEWDTRRWRALFDLLLNRRVMDRVYEPAFFEHLEKPSFAAHFRGRAEHTLTRLPLRDNYFVHQMLTGAYPLDETGGVPPYLGVDGFAALRAATHRLSLFDGTFTACLGALPAGSVRGFVLSNICEWLHPPQVDELFAEIVRTAAPGAVLCFRNFVGWTEVPERWRGVVVEDRERGEALMERDRSVVQRRFALCRVHARGGVS